jgi:drug/metabolite transporter (DMT)-like permease
VWNTALASRPRGLDTSAVAVGLGLLLWTPLALARWRVDAHVWPYVLLSAAFELAYFWALTAAYARAPAPAVYPVARGAAPVLLLPATVLFGTGVPAWTALAVLAIGAGIVLTARGAGSRGATLAALPVAVCIAGYTFVDARGLHHADPATYLWLVMVPVVVGLAGARLARPGGPAALRSQFTFGTALVGVGIYGAYGLTLAALALVPASGVPAVAAVRETGILFVVVIGWVTARTRPAVSPSVGAALVFAGVALLGIAF